MHAVAAFTLSILNLWGTWQGLLPVRDVVYCGGIEQARMVGLYSEHHLVVSVSINSTHHR